MHLYDCAGGVLFKGHITSTNGSAVVQVYLEYNRSSWGFNLKYHLKLIN